MRHQDYYTSVYNTARSLGATDLQAHLAASQASLETGYGRSVKGNNHFGIKAGSKYAGKTVDFGTHEFFGGQKVGMTDRFRAYDDLAGSVRGYMDFMARNFPEAWNATTFKDAAEGLKNGRYGSYATDPKYDDKIASIAGRFGPAATGQAFLPAPVPSSLPATLTAPQFNPSVPARSVDTSRIFANPPSLAAGARAASELQDFLPSIPTGPVTRAPLPDLPSPAVGARAAAGLQGIDQPAYGARAASGLQSYQPGSITLPDIPATLSAPPSLTRASVPAAPPAIDRTSVQSLPSVAAPPNGLSISLPSAVPATSVQTSKLGPEAFGAFPAPPPSPGRRAGKDALTGAAKGAMTGGLPGAIMGAVLGPAMAQIGRNVASNRVGVGSRINPFNGVFSAYKNLFNPLGRSLTGMGLLSTPNYSAPQYSVGSGYGAIGSVFGGPAGATATSRSNPEVSFTSLGNGYVSRSNSQYGTTQTMAPGSYDPGIFGGSQDKGGKGKK